MRGRFLIWFILAAGLLSPSTGYVASYPELLELKTRLGVVRVLREDPNLPGSDNITVDGKLVLQSGKYVGIYKQFETADSIAVLFGENQGGNNWVWDLSFLLLKPKQKPVIVTNKSFFSADATVKPRQEGYDVVVELGFENKKRKTARLRSGELTVELTPVVPAIPVSEDACRLLYENSTDECIKYGKLPKSPCERIGPEYSGISIAVMSDITILSNHPGFVKEALTEICIKECESGAAVPYEEFKKSVCSIK